MAGPSHAQPADPSNAWSPDQARRAVDAASPAPAAAVPEPAPRRTTRLAPSPTGALHLGNARSFLINWALARQAQWRLIMRMEDLDSPRVKPGADQQAFDDLAWLGLDWDGQPLYQRCDLTAYHHALTQLWHMGYLYPCRCTRSEIQQAQSAPHSDDHELRYPGICRPPTPAAPTGPADEPRAAPAFESDDAPVAWRVLVPEQPVRFHDELHGEQTVDLQDRVGDFVVATKAGLPAYQLAVVVDDARQGVTDVVRGDDLLAATARQVWLYDALGLKPRPRYWHLPLVIGEDGRRLAKRHGDTRIATYRQAGVSAQRVVGLLACWSGVTRERQPMTAGEFAANFNLDQLPRQAAVFTQEDHAWLMGN